MIYGVPYRLMLIFLAVLWAVSSFGIYVFAPQMRARHLKILGWGFLSAAIALGMLMAGAILITTIG